MTIAFPPPRPGVELPERPSHPVRTAGMSQEKWDATVAAWDAAEAKRDAADDALLEQAERDYQKQAEAAWGALTLEEKFDWADSHDIHTLVVEDVVYDVKTRQRRGQNSPIESASSGGGVE